MSGAGVAGVSAAVGFVTTPAVRRLAMQLGATDLPGERRIHARPTARGGGLAVVAAALVAAVLEPRVVAPLTPAVCAGLVLVVATGLVDDVSALGAQAKLGAQLLAALLAVAGGLRLGLVPDAGPVDAALTVVWIVLVTNAFNLCDGLDGLAAGLGLIALAWLSMFGRHELTFATAALAGGLLGFLPYNVHPSRIFLGDGGSLLIGYALAVLPLAGGPASPLPFAALVLVVAVPVTDLLLAVARRFCSRCLRAWGDGLVWEGIVEGLRSTIRPDRRHIHHRLLDLGLPHPRAVIVLYAAGAVMAALAAAVVHVSAWPIDMIALGAGIAVVALIRALGFDELRPARSGLLLPVARRLVRRRDVWPAFDIVLAAASYGGALLLTGAPVPPRAELPAVLAVMAIAEVGALAAFGTYRRAWASEGLGGLTLLLRASAVSTIAGYVVLRLVHLPASGAAAVVHLELVVAAVALLRLAPVLIAHAARRGDAAEPALICGTAAEARHVVGRLRRVAGTAIVPIGFVELAPHWQGTTVHRLPVLGTLEALDEMLREHRVRHLVVADPRLRGRALDWVRAVCRARDVRVYRYTESLVPDATSEPAHDVAAVAAAG